MLETRPWIPAASTDLITEVAGEVAAGDALAIEARLMALVAENRAIHELDCVNLNPAGNVMNPRAEALLAAGLGTRASLGYPADKYEMGLEAVERIEIMAAELAAELFGARYVEFRSPSGSLANLSVFMAVAKPGDAIIVPPPEIGGHVTHHKTGAAGLYGLVVHSAPVDARGYTVDVAALREQARQVRPRLITIGGSLNLFAHPIAAMRAVADEVGAVLMFDAAHMSGVIAGGAWQQPLAEGAHAMTMSTYKSLGGPAGGLVVTNDASLAQRLEAIAFPGLTANFDAGKTAALAMSLLDWKVFGRDYAAAMVATAKALADALTARGVRVFASDRGATTSHQFALEAAPYGGGQTAAKRLRRANILSCGIGLPIAPVAGDANGLRLGTPEIVRFGMGPGDMRELADLIAQALEGNRAPEDVAGDVSAFRRRFTTLRYMRT